MTEMQQALGMVRHLPANVLSKNPAGTWSFGGKVDARLAFYMKDGSELTHEIVANIKNFGLSVFRNRVGIRTWKTEQEALDALASLDSH